MADSGVFRQAPLAGWQRDSILAAATFLRDRFGNPPSDPRARTVHDSLLEVLDPSRRAVRLQREMTETTRKAAAVRAVRRAQDRRAADRRKANVGPPAGSKDRRIGERRTVQRRKR